MSRILFIFVGVLLASSSIPATSQDSSDIHALLSQAVGLVKASRAREAEPFAVRALALAEGRYPPNHPDVSRAVEILAIVYNKSSKVDDAERMYKRALSIMDSNPGPHNTSLGTVLYNLALLLKDQGRCREAEPYFARDLALTEQRSGANAVLAAITLIDLGDCHNQQGRALEAENVLRRAIGILDQPSDTNNRELGLALNGLGLLYLNTDRLIDAASLLLRALSVLEQASGPDSLEVVAVHNNLGLLFMKGKRMAEAETSFFRAMKIMQGKLPPDDPRQVQTLGNIGGVYLEQQNYAKALPVLQSVVAYLEKRFGPSSPKLITDLNNLALTYHGLGRTSDAVAVNRRSLTIVEGSMGHSHPRVAALLGNLASLHVSQKDWPGAVEALSRAAQIIVTRTSQGTGRFTGSDGRLNSERSLLLGLVHASYYLAEAQKGKARELSSSALAAAQWAQASEAAASIALTSARVVKGDAALASLIREQQDLAAELQMRDRQLVDFLSRPGADRSPSADGDVRSRMAAIEKRLGEIDQRLRAGFPDYAAYAKPEPVPLAEIQALLAPDEALVFFVHMNATKAVAAEHSFMWVITRGDARWVRNDLGAGPLKDRVDALRCGLDASELAGADGWSATTPEQDRLKQDVQARQRRCQSLLKTDYTPGRGAGPLPYDLDVAHGVFESLFGKVKDMIANKHLLIVPSFATQGLAFSALVTERPRTARPSEELGYRDAKWLALSNPVTILPSVASLKALRAKGRNRPTAPEPYIGIGNPELLGTPSCGAVRPLAACPGVDSAASTGTSGQRKTAYAARRPVRIDTLRRGAFADVAAIRSQCPLPETGFELTCVARSIGTGAGRVIVGKAATERAVRALPLERYRIVHFATHGVLPGEAEALLQGTAQPGLILTPPASGSEEDDGLLTSSEIAQLRLNADWVILSACNTAGAAQEGGNTLSGLATSFFYAGAQALLVSQWYVNSEAAVKLVTRTFSVLKDTPKLGRAEGLRRSMVALITEDGGHTAHPAYWAPFVVVGEGTR